MLLSEASTKYQQDKKIEGYSPLTLKTYYFQYNLLLRFFGDIDMSRISTEKLKEYLLQSGEHLKPSRLGYKVRCVKSLFKWTHEEGDVPKNPAAKLKEPKLGKRIPKFLTGLEIEHLRETCQTTMENALFGFMYSTGCRIGEVVKLNRDEIDFRTNSVIVHRKGDKEREVYFNTRCSIWLKRYLDERDDGEPCLFIADRRPKRRSSIDNLRYIIKRILKRQKSLLFY